MRGSLIYLRIVKIMLLQFFPLLGVTNIIFHTSFSISRSHMCARTWIHLIVHTHKKILPFLSFRKLNIVSLAFKRWACWWCVLAVSQLVFCFQEVFLYTRATLQHVSWQQLKPDIFGLSPICYYGCWLYKLFTTFHEGVGGHQFPAKMENPGRWGGLKWNSLRSGVWIFSGTTHCIILLRTHNNLVFQLADYLGMR